MSHRALQDLLVLRVKLLLVAAQATEQSFPVKPSRDTADRCPYAEHQPQRTQCCQLFAPEIGVGLHLLIVADVYAPGLITHPAGDAQRTADVETAGQNVEAGLLVIVLHVP